MWTNKAVVQHAFVNATGVPVELYQTDGSVGAALGAGVGVGFYNSHSAAFANRQPLKLIEPTNEKEYQSVYNEWKILLEVRLAQTSELSSIIN